MSIVTGLLPSRPAGRIRPGWVDGYVAESRRLTSEPLARLLRGRLPLAFTSSAIVALLWSAHFTMLGTEFVRSISAISAFTPLRLVVVRLPASMFAAAPNLPIWGSLLQVFVVFAVAEAWIGWRRTLAIALVTTFVCTLSGRIMCSLGPDTIVGLPWIEKFVPDTGPSAAVVALVVYVCCLRRAPRTLALVLTALIAEAAVLPNLAGREHLVAIAFGLLAAVAVPAPGRIRLYARTACQSAR